jgi:hypothetical protein
MHTDHDLPHLLFVTYGAGHADIVARLYTKLASRGDIRISVLALTTAGGLLDRHSIPYRRILDYLPMAGYEEALVIGEQMSQGFWDPSSGVPEMESHAYLGVSMVDLIQEHGEAAARVRYARLGRQAFCPARFIARVFETEKPDVVVTTCAVRMELAALIEARRSGIASVLIEDLFGYSILGERQVADGQLAIQAAALPEHVVVMNEAVRARIVSAGFPAQRIHALGQPVFAEWMEALAIAPVARQLKPAFEAGRIIITYVAPSRRDVLYEQAAAILALARRWPERVVCIKLHPSVGRAEFKSRYPELPENVVLLKDEDIVTVIRATSVALVFRSTVGLLCLLAGTPFLILDTTGEPDTMPYVSDAAVPKVEQYALLDEELEKLLASGRGSMQAQSPLFGVMPGAAARIASFLAGLAHSRRLSMK